MSKSPTLEQIAATLFETVDPQWPIEAALLLRRTGTILAAWTKDSVPEDVVSVMAATMLGSIGTMSEALGFPWPERMMIETGMCRMLAETVEPHGVLLLVGRKAESSEALRRAAARILERLSKASGNGPETSPAESEPVEVSRPSQRRPAV